MSGIIGHDIRQMLSKGTLPPMQKRSSIPSSAVCNLLHQRGLDKTIPWNSEGQHHQWSVARHHIIPSTDPLCLNYEQSSEQNLRFSRTHSYKTSKSSRKLLFCGLLGQRMSTWFPYDTISIHCLGFSRTIKSQKPRIYRLQERLFIAEGSSS